MYIEQVPYQTEQPPRLAASQPGKLRMYALSTCAFCERAMQYLRDNGLPFEYLMVDSLEPELKRNLKSELKQRFGNIPVFPLLTINDEKPISGFTEDKYREFLGLHE